MHDPHPQLQQRMPRRRLLPMRGLFSVARIQHPFQLRLDTLYRVIQVRICVPEFRIARHGERPCHRNSREGYT